MPTEVRGHAVTLPGNRSVFIGRVADDENRYLQFTNNGTVRRLKLSAEATLALKSLLAGNGVGTPQQHTLSDGHEPGRWQVVRDLEA